MAIINTKDYSNKDEFWNAVSAEITAGKSRPSPSGYHNFNGKIYLKDKQVLAFTRYSEILSYIGKSYFKTPIKYIEINFMPSPTGMRPRMSPRPKP